MTPAYGPAPRPDNDNDNQRPVPPPPAKPTPTELLVKHWGKLALLLVLIIFAGLYLWLRSAKQKAQRDSEPVAAASTNIESGIADVKKDADKNQPAGSTVAVLEAQRRAEQDAAMKPAPATDEEIVQVFAVDTTGQAERKKQRARAAAAKRIEEAKIAAQNVDTIETTVQDPSTGAYRSETKVVPRGRSMASSGRGSSGRRTGSGRNSGPQLPARDTDGTPFETDPDVLNMLSSSPLATRQAYEQMTGKRYRDPNQAAQVLAAKLDAPGMDGFNTVKVGGSSRSMMAQGKQQQLTPDVFYQCVINGEQKVRSGSVVMLRLVEDAIVSGVTFPKNMVFAGIASVNSNSVTLEVTRLGPTRVEASIYDFNYMPGIMIDPVKRVAKDAQMAGNDIQQQTTQELGSAIDRSASAANSVVGVGGRVATTILSRPRNRTKLRDVLLPDGYPILITTAAAGQMGPDAATTR
jgi:hypothetical protein